VAALITALILLLPVLVFESPDYRLESLLALSAFFEEALTFRPLPVILEAEFGSLN